MIISKTPYRISFFGGGTDYPQWYLKNGGEVISTTIDKYLYLTCRYLPPFFDYKHRIVWKFLERTKNIKDIKHKPVREYLRYLKIKKGIELHYDGDLPAQSGMGSSSSFIVGLINTLTELRGFKLTKSELSKKSLNFEQNILKEVVGSQDQIACSYGGFNSIKFNKSGKYSINNFNLSPIDIQKLNGDLVLVYSNQSRRAHDIANSYVFNLNNKKKKQMLEIQNFVITAKNFLKEKKFEDFGYLLGESWEKKKELGKKISTPYIDLLYKKGIKSGALGGKLLGAGGGGMFLFYVPKNIREKFLFDFKKNLIIPFSFETDGSTIIFNSKDRLNKR